MRRIVVTVVVVAMLGGCTRKTAPVAIGFGGLFTLGGVVVIAALSADDDSAAGLGLFPLMLGVPLLIAGFAGLGNPTTPAALDCSERREQRSSACVAYRHTRAITEIAAEEARAGNCDAVAGYAREIYELDPRLYANMFMFDAEIRRCLYVGAGPGGGGSASNERAVTESERRQAEEAEESRLREAQAKRGRVRALTDQAAAKARAGDCESVAKTDRAVRDLDPEFHATVFVRDAGIKRCLDAAAPVAPAVQP